MLGSRPVGLNVGGQFDLLRRVRLVALLGTPSQGAPLASIGSSWYPEIEVLAVNSDYVRLLDTLWGYLIRDRDRSLGGFPVAVCAHETETTAGVEVVDRVHAKTECDDFYPLLMNHSELAKPKSANDDQYLWVKRHIVDSRAAPAAPVPISKSSSRAANVLAVFRGVYFVKRTEGEYLAVVNATLRNTGESSARLVRMQHQHRPGERTGVVGPSEAFEIPARGEIGVQFSADTYADPIGSLRRGERAYFALRADWETVDGVPACAVFFLEYFGAPGAEVGQTVIMRFVHADVPDRLKGPKFALGVCSG